jgi:muramoyltetrapeptide carboxypeptidase LdcA involved in peptidoglycan recycling
MHPRLTVPRKLKPGERVAVVSPSFAAPGAFPAVHELAMRRLAEELGVEPVEYPSTRRLGAPAQARAADLMAAFTDPGIGAVLASIGGDDQLTVLPYLDAEVLAAHLKIFCGYSDNTNLLNYLWNLGIAGYYGGSTMVHLGGRAGGPHPVSVAALRAALFSGDDLELFPAERFGEDEADWGKPETLAQEGPTSPGTGWTWHQPDRVVTGPTWGGDLEILQWNLAAGRWIRPPEDYAGCVLLLETDRSCRALRRSSGCCATWANEGCSRSSRRCCSAGPRRPSSACRPRVASVTATAPSNGRRCCAPSRPITRTPWWSSTSTSATPTRSG